MILSSFSPDCLFGSVILTPFLQDSGNKKCLPGTFIDSKVPNRQSGENEERIIEIEIERLRPFKEHPFQVKDDKEMFLLQESIEKYGILNPLIVRPVPDGYYEIISGHRRKHAAEKLG